jgi:hypothetical protein
MKVWKNGSMEVLCSRYIVLGLIAQLQTTSRYDLIVQ